MLANPTLMREERQAAQDVALLVIDESPSQEFAQRQDRTQKVVQHAVSSLRALENIELRVVRAGALAQGLTTRTDLFKAIDTAYANVPLSRRAGVVIISDGQIHDVPGYPWHEGAGLPAEGPGPAGEKKESAITSGNEEGWNKLSGGRAFGTENKRKTGAADTGEDEEMHAADTYGPVHLLLVCVV